MTTKASADISLFDHFNKHLTKQDVECVVEKSLGSKASIINYYVESYSNKNLGLMGAHLNLVVEISRDSQSKTKEIHTYFLKTVPYHMESQTKFLEDSKMFDKETIFYNSIMPELMKNSKDKSWAPQCYLAKKDILVFENLKVKNYIMESKFLNVSLLKAALSSLAKMHAASLLAEKRLGRTFIEIYPHLMDEVLFSRDGPFAGWYRAGINVATEVAQHLGLHHEVVPTVMNMILEKILPSKTRRNVLNHGDTWSNNFMFNGEKCALVDFQLLRYVPPMVDVAQAMYFNARRDLREKHTRELLKHYHEHLCDVLQDGGMDCPSFEDILEEYEEMKVVGMVSISLYFPVVHISEDKMNEIMKGSSGFLDLFNKDRVSMVFDLLEKDERYKELITSTVRELVDMSKTLLK